MNPGVDPSPEVAYYLSERGYRVPEWCRPALRTPEPRRAAGARFEPARVDRVLAALRCLRHTQGRWAGQPLEPAAWQVAHVLAPVFGWVSRAADGTVGRIVRSAYVELPRKNGKTTLASGLALYLAFADGEAGAQVLAVAGSAKQARHCFDPAARLARSAPVLRSAGVIARQARIVQPHTGSYFEVAASMGDLLHGANVHAAIVDELHVHKRPDVLDAVESGTGARRQPLVLVITTADDGRAESVYAHRRDYIERLARGSLRDPATFGVVFAADEADADSDAAFTPATWRMANPGFGVSPSKEFLTAEARKARQSAAYQARFLRLHLGIRTRQGGRFLDLAAWDRNAGMVDESALSGRVAYGGLDLASTADLTALCWVLPDRSTGPGGSGGGFDVVWRIWCPQARLLLLDERTGGAATTWVKQGHLMLTPGEVCDYGVVRDQVAADLERFDVAELAYNPWNPGTELVNELMADGAPVATLRPGYAAMSAPAKELQRLIMAGTPEVPLLRHGGHPVARWAADNLCVQINNEGDVKPSRRDSRDKIDPITALIMALGRATAAEQTGDSVYESQGLAVM